jgi:hypothetical protein
MTIAYEVQPADLQQQHVARMGGCIPFSEVTWLGQNDNS